MVHFGKGSLFRLVDVGVQQLIELPLCLAGGVLHGQQHTFRHLGVVLGLGTEGTETIAADLFAEFRVVLWSAQIPGQKLFFSRQQRFVDEPDQTV